jgi:hypothetical protein
VESQNHLLEVHFGIKEKKETKIFLLELFGVRKP